MRLQLALLLLFGFCAAEAFAHGAGPIILVPLDDSGSGKEDDPEPDDPEAPNPGPVPPNSGVTPGEREPSDDEDPPEADPPGPPPPPPPPPLQPPQAPLGPTTPDDLPPPGGEPNPGGAEPPKKRRGTRRGGPRGEGSRPRPSKAVDSGWRVWWEFNRESLVGFRHILHGRGTVTGKRSTDAPDALAGRRDEVLKALRDIALGREHETLRAATLIALGRMGGDEDARIFLALLRDATQHNEVHEGAALGLGLLPKLGAKDVRDSAREHLTYYMATPRSLSRRARHFTFIASGLRARDDKMLLMSLARHALGKVPNRYDAAVAAYACGLANDRMLVPELTQAVRRGTFGGRKLSDIGRSHATQALAMLDDPLAAKTMLGLLRSRRARGHTKRSAVLALGRMLRHGVLDREDSTRAHEALRKAFEDHSDPVLRGFAAIALGGAAQTNDDAIRVLRNSLDKGGAVSIRPYAALALGMAARNTKDEITRKALQKFLSRELKKCREQELASALAIALGLCAAHEAQDQLLARVANERLRPAVRGSAAEAVGLLGRDSPKAWEVLNDALTNGPKDMVGDVALALGMLGRRSTAARLVARLARVDSVMHQGRIMLALGHLGHPGAVDPLLDVLADRTEKQIVREFATVALGLMGDVREQDVLFAIDGDFNFLATTSATYELVRLY